METPYLVQRANFDDRKESSGIDSILRFDYMGSTEFEFGALHDSLKRIRTEIGKYSKFYTNINGKQIEIFSKTEDQQKAVEFINGMSTRKYKLIEYSDFDTFIGLIKNTFELKCRTDFWWDIGNDFMFWKSNKEFTEKFLRLIG